MGGVIASTACGVESNEVDDTMVPPRALCVYGLRSMFSLFADASKDTQSVRAIIAGWRN